MKTKGVWVHGIWGLAVVAAFVAGSSRDPKTTSTDDSNTHVPERERSSRNTLEGGMDRSGRLSARDPREAREQGELARIFGNTSALGIEELSLKAFKDPNPITRRLAFSKLLESMTPENAAGMREELKELGMDDSEWRDFHYAWGAMSGKEAFDFAASSEEEDLAITMSGWAAANPTEAVAMLAQLPEEMQGQRNELSASVVAGVADHDIGMATALAFDLVNQGYENGSALIRTVANEALRTTSPAEAAAWVNDLADGAMKGSAMNRVADAYVSTDPEQAAGWVAEYANEDYAQSAIAEVGEEWGERDPESALGWLTELPAGGGQREGFRSVFGDWEDTNPVAASEYLATMQPSPERDAAVSGFARGYAWQDPEAALAWAEDISDPQIRQESLTQVGQAYYRRDPEAARAWLEQSGLPAEAQQQVISPRRRR